jgi:broad specificity phosphatase PhoE
MLIESQLERIRSFNDAIDHFKRYRIGNVSASKLIRAIATAKGIAKRLGKKELDDFFG